MVAVSRRRAFFQWRKKVQVKQYSLRMFVNMSVFLDAQVPFFRAYQQMGRHGSGRQPVQSGRHTNNAVEPERWNSQNRKGLITADVPL